MNNEDDIEKLHFRGMIAGYSKLSAFDSKGRQIYSKTFPAGSITKKQPFEMRFTGKGLVWKKHDSTKTPEFAKYRSYAQIVIYAYDVKGHPIFKTIQYFYKK